MLSNKQKEKLFDLADALHRRFLGVEMSIEVRKFIGNLSWSFFGGIIAAGILFGLSIFAGRVLGPEEYGLYGLTIAITVLLIIPMTLGVDTALTYYVPRSQKEEEKKIYIQSSLPPLVVLTCVVFVTVFFLTPLLARVFSIPPSVLYLSGIMGIFLASRSVIDACMRGLKYFQWQSGVKILEALTIVSGFTLLSLWYTEYNFIFLVWATILGYGISIMLEVYRARQYSGISGEKSRELVSYGKYVMLGFVFTVTVSSIDKILVNKFLGPEELGVYMAYSTASVILIGQMITMFMNVLFPFFSATHDDGQFLSRINKIYVSVVPFLFPIFLVGIYIAVRLFGPQYRVDYLLIVELGILCVFMVYFNILWALIASRSKEGFRFTAVQGTIASLLFVVGVVVLRTELSLYIVIALLIASFMYTCFVGNLYYKRYV